MSVQLLSHLHWWGTAWKANPSTPTHPDPTSNNDNNPASTTLAVVQLLADLTTSHEIALRVRMAPPSRTAPILVSEATAKQHMCLGVLGPTSRALHACGCRMQPGCQSMQSTACGQGLIQTWLFAAQE